MSQTTWETGLPELPDGFTFSVNVGVGDTDVLIKAASGEIVSTETLEVREYMIETVYLSRVWDSANRQANRVKDMVERIKWLRERFYS